MKKIIFIVVFVLIVVIGLFVYDHYRIKTLDSIDRATIEAFIDDNDVQIELREAMIDKIENDELWDSEKVEIIESVLPATYLLDFTRDKINRHFRFDDGSFIAMTTEIIDRTSLDGSEVSYDLLSPYIKEEDLSFYVDKGEVVDLEVSMLLGLTTTTFKMKVGLFNGNWIEDMLLEISDVNISGFGSIKDIEYGIISQVEDPVEDNYAKGYISWQYSRSVNKHVVDITQHIIIGVGEDSYYLAPYFIK